MSVAALVVAGLALLFTVASFWWLNWRRGRLVFTAPHAFALVANPAVCRLRLPLAIFNTGARAIVVSDLRCWLPDTQQVLALPWTTTRKTLRPEKDDVHDFATPFPVRGREALTVVAEFGGPFAGFTITGGAHKVRLEVLEAGRSWRAVVEFDLHAPDDADLRARYLAHSNHVDDPETIKRAEAAASRLLAGLRAATVQPQVGADSLASPPPTSNL